MPQKQSVFDRIGRNILCAILLTLGMGAGGQETEAQNRPAGAPAITGIHTFSGGGLWILYTGPDDLGEPPATTKVLIRNRRVGQTAWDNPNGVGGQLRAVNSQDQITPYGTGHLWSWEHDENGGEIVTFASSSKFISGSWEFQIAYTNGQAPVAWSPLRAATIKSPREVHSATLTAGPGSFRVAWIPSQIDAGAEAPATTGWKVLYRKSGTTTWSETDISDAGARSHTQTGLDSETAYEVQIAATNSTGTGVLPANPQTVTTLAGSLSSPSIPQPPANLRATQSGNNLALTWDAPAGGPTPTAYQVRWRAGATTAERDVAAWSNPVQVTQRTHTIAGISDSVLYEAQVASITDTILAFPAFTAWDVTARGPEITLPEKPANLAATHSGTNLTATWDAPTSGAVVTKYQIRWRTGGTRAQRNRAAWSSPVTVTGGKATGNTHTIPGISNAVFYQVEVASVTDQLIAFPEFIKWEARVGGPRITVPFVPTGLTATHGNGALTLNWVAPTQGAAVGTYRVRWRSGASVAARDDAEWSAPVQVENALHYVIPNISNDRTTLYQAQVASITDDLLVFTGLIHWKTTVQWPEITAPEPPQNLRAAHSGDTLTLTWDAPASGATASAYRVRYKIGSSETSLETAGWSAPTQVTSRSQSISGITTGTFFEAQVASITPDLVTFPGFIQWEASVGWPNRPPGVPRFAVVPQFRHGFGHYFDLYFSAPDSWACQRPRTSAFATAGPTTGLGAMPAARQDNSAR